MPGVRSGRACVCACCPPQARMPSAKAPLPAATPLTARAQALVEVSPLPPPPSAGASTTGTLQVAATTKRATSRAGWATTTGMRSGACSRASSRLARSATTLPSPWALRNLLLAQLLPTQGTFLQQLLLCRWSVMLDTRAWSHSSLNLIRQNIKGPTLQGQSGESCNQIRVTQPSEQGQLLCQSRPRAVTATCATTCSASHHRHSTSLSNNCSESALGGKTRSAPCQPQSARTWCAGQ